MNHSPDILDSPALASSGEEARRAIRRGVWTGATSGLATNCMQAHVVILPASLAEDFRDFCVRNPQACPLLSVSDPGQIMLPTLGDDIDVRCDVPSYQVWRYGELTAESSDIVSVWRRDLVTFVIASSSTFEQSLRAGDVDAGAGAAANGSGAPIYNSQLQTAMAGPFRGPMLVTMRPLRSERITQAIEVSTRLDEPQGTPVHIGRSSLIGIHDLSTPAYGVAREVAADELPVFWGSGLTAQAVVLRALPPLCITNAPGAMLVTDLLHRQIASRDAAVRPDSGLR